jgi:hypothetical protein
MGLFPPPHPSLRAALELERVQMETAPTFMFGVEVCTTYSMCQCHTSQQFFGTCELAAQNFLQRHDRDEDHKYCAVLLFTVALEIYTDKKENQIS